ncbi:DUF5067 domain-containing protein [Staphylococcus ratti]|uniref:DUF5067 domain-containing protein n=1 Tax=Staphylococcus ratti TaxID=2892440 RepID=A0ABY3PDL8_9STAP|nr:DUF5067 domain-containing protein [Staphylococcus ratti]UEX90374.1 DUF5067 domain-containing protein [Staphylococcus ratti]
MKKLLSALCVSVIILSGCDIMGNSKKETEEENIGEGYFKEDTLKTKEAEFKIKETKLVESFSQDDDEGPYIAFIYEYTNKSKENKSASKEWDDYFEAHNDDKNVEKRLFSGYVSVSDKDSKYYKYKENGDLLVKPKDNVTSMMIYKIDKKEGKVILRGHTSDKTSDSESKTLGEKVINIKK